MNKNIFLISALFPKHIIFGRFIDYELYYCIAMVEGLSVNNG
jgi:hypothetical protein